MKNIVPVRAKKPYGRAEVYLYSSLTSTSWEYVVTPRPLHPQGTRRCIQSWYGPCGGEIKFLCLKGIQHRLPGRPARAFVIIRTDLSRLLQVISSEEYSLLWLKAVQLTDVSKDPAALIIRVDVYSSSLIGKAVDSSKSVSLKLFLFVPPTLRRQS